LYTNTAVLLYLTNHSSSVRLSMHNADAQPQYHYDYHYHIYGTGKPVTLSNLWKSCPS